VITVKDDATPTTGVATDFGIPKVEGGTSLTPSSGVVFVPGGATMTFELVSPSTVGDLLAITGRMATGTLFAEGAVYLTVVGTPTTASSVACTGDRSGTTSVRVGELVTCIITVNDDSGATTGVPSDFDSPAIIGGTNPSPSTGVALVGGGSTMKITVVAPTTVGATFTVTGKLASGEDFSEGAFDLTVVGSPTTKSTVACEGDRSGTPSIRVGEDITCVVTVEDDSGPTTGVATDFALPIIVGGTNPIPADGVTLVSGGATMTVKMKAPTSVGAIFTVQARLANLDVVDQAPFALTVGKQ